MKGHGFASRATGIGVIAVILWACLALLTTATYGIASFELLALSFGIAFLTSLTILGRKGRAGFADWRQPWPVWATGFFGIFVYHALYFYALKAAPPAEASLINYLWPLLIVVFANLASRQGFRLHHIAGGAMGLAGTALLILQRSQPIDAAPMTRTTIFGYGAAFACAFVWSGYSVFNRRFKGISSAFLGGVFGMVALAGLLCSLAVEDWVWPNAVAWASIVTLGIGPVGAAFFAWDFATKNGNLPVLGALSYLAPLLSTMLLVLFGQAPASWSLLLAALLIIGGAVVVTFRR